MGRYWLPGNAGSEQPGNMLFMHCLPAESVLSPETKGNHFLKLGMASFEAFRVDDGSITRFQRTSRRLAMSFWDDLVVRLRKREPLWCFGYRIGHQLTWLGFWDMVDNGTFQIRSLVDDDPPVIIRGSMNGCNVVFVDVRNYFRCHLSELVVRAGLALDPVDPNCEHTEHAIEWSFNVIVAISRNILSLMNLVKCHDLGTWKTTAPAQAFQAYRHRLHEKMGYVKSTITNGVETKREDITVIPPLIHRVNAVIDMEREASYAGRTCPFWVGKVLESADDPEAKRIRQWPADGAIKIGPVYQFDVNSMFPYIMGGEQFPFDLDQWGAEINPTELFVRFQADECLARVLVKTDTPDYPLRWNGEVIYPVGLFWTTLAGPELEHALIRGRIKHVQCWAHYHMASMFRSYVNFFSVLRKQFKEAGDRVGEEVAKLMANSLYGKFGSHAYKWEDDSEAILEAPWCRWAVIDWADKSCVWYRSIGEHIQRQTKGGESQFSFPAIPAFVTSYARVYMDVVRSWLQPGSVLYQNVDGLLVDKLGLEDIKEHLFVDDTDPGALRLKAAYATAEIRGIRDYTVDGRLVKAGVPEDAVPLRENAYTYQSLQKLGSILCRKPTPFVSTVKVTARYSRVLKWGSIGADGYVSPLVFGANMNGSNAPVQSEE